jgi:hypothetical protein
MLTLHTCWYMQECKLAEEDTFFAGDAVFQCVCTSLRAAFNAKVPDRPQVGGDRELQSVPVWGRML